MARSTSPLPDSADAGALEELCRRAGVSLTVGYELAHRNALPVPVFRVGRQFRYSRRAWDVLMAAQHGAPEHQEATNEAA